MLFNVLFIKESWKKESITFSTKMLSRTTFLTLIIIRKVSWAANHHIKMISEGSCDTNDWRLSTNTFKTLILNCNNILKYYCFFICIFNQIIAALVNIKVFIKHKRLSKSILKNLLTPNYSIYVLHKNIRFTFLLWLTFWFKFINEKTFCEAQVKVFLFVKEHKYWNREYKVLNLQH